MGTGPLACVFAIGVSVVVAGCDVREPLGIDDSWGSAHAAGTAEVPSGAAANCEGTKSVWKARSFEFPNDREACTGASYVRFNEEYGLWAGVVLCPQDAVRIYLAENEQGPFLPATDTAGHGQDHCELVNPSFRIPDEDDITSGGCGTCSTGRNLPLEGVPVYSRARYGERFRFVPSTPTWSHQVSKLACGVSIASAAGGCDSRGP